MGDNMNDGIAIALALAKGEGHSIGVDGWYVSNQGDHYSVYYYFYIDNRILYAEWWYYPGTGEKIPANEWARTFMGE